MVCMSLRREDGLEQGLKIMKTGLKKRLKAVWGNYVGTNIEGL